MDFSKVISFESLYKAHRRARLGKRHKKEVVLFEANLSENLWELHNQLKDKTYSVGGYHMFTIHDPKEREIQAISYRDRVVQHSLCDNYLSPLLERHLIYDNAACRKNKGSSFAIKRLKHFMCEHYKKHKTNGYFVKIDVKKYFASVSHSLTKQKLAKIALDKDCYNLLCSILDSYNLNEGKGLPMGNQSSQCLALLYLNDFDRYYKEKLQIKYYIRYMDDIIMLVPTKEIAKKCLFEANRLLTKEKLMINPKSKILPVKNGMEFLGWNFKLLPTGKILQKLRKSTKKRIVKKVKLLFYQTTNNILPQFKKQESLTSYKGLFLKGNTHLFYNNLVEYLHMA